MKFTALKIILTSVIVVGVMTVTTTMIAFAIDRAEERHMTKNEIMQSQQSEVPEYEKFVIEEVYVNTSLSGQLNWSKGMQNGSIDFRINRHILTDEILSLSYSDDADQHFPFTEHEDEIEAAINKAIGL